jgi:hypothetical protein
VIHHVKGGWQPDLRAAGQQWKGELSLAAASISRFKKLLQQNP